MRNFAGEKKKYSRRIEFVAQYEMVYFAQTLVT